MESFYLRDDNELRVDEPGSSHELRRKYWAYALPVIKDAHRKKAKLRSIGCRWLGFHANCSKKFYDVIVPYITGA